MVTCTKDKILNPLTGRCILKVNSIKHNKSLKKLLKQPCVDTEKKRSTFTGRCIQKESKSIRKRKSPKNKSKSKSRISKRKSPKNKSKSKSRISKRKLSKNKSKSKSTISKRKSPKNKSKSKSRISKRKSPENKSKSKSTISKRKSSTKKSKSLKKTKSKLADYDGMLAIDICRKYKTNRKYWTPLRLAKIFNVTIPQVRISVAEAFC